MREPVSMSRAEYDRLPGVNWSTLKHMGRSPAQYQHAVTSPAQRDTDALKRGRATHHAVFEPELFRSTYVVWDGGTRRGKEWDAFRARNAGLEILTDDMHTDVLAIAAAVRSSTMAAKYVSGGKSEQSLAWLDRESGLDCKGRVDFIAATGGGVIVDLKTCRDSSPSGFGRQVAQLEYHAQAACYSDGHLAMTGQELPYVLVAVEVTAPYVVQVYRIHGDILDAGRNRYRELLGKVAACRKSNSWPGYFETEADLALPRWAAPSQDEEDVTGLGLDFAKGE